MLIAAPTCADLKSQGFKKLSGAQIRQAFLGHTFSDEVHFTFRYPANGTVEGTFMGKKVAQKWRVEKDVLCLMDSFGDNCYTVWKNGIGVKCSVGDAGFWLEGLLK